MTKDIGLELRIIGSDGSGLRILPGAWPLDWSPDGSFLLALVPRNKNANPELGLVSVADGSLTTLGTVEKPISSW